MKLCSVEDVRQRLRQSHRLEEVRLLESWIEATSLLIEKFLGRKLEQAARTEYYDGGSSFLWLKAYPVSTVDSVEVTYDGRWTSPTVLRSDDYVVDTEHGVIEYLVGEFPNGRRRVRVTYTGGYAVGSDGVLQVPRPIRQACIDQVAYFYMHRDNIGLQNVSLDAGSVGGLERWGLLSGVKSMLLPYRRPYA